MVLSDTAENAIAHYKRQGVVTEGNGDTLAAAARSGTGTHRIESLNPLTPEFAARSAMTFRVKIAQLKEDAKFHLSLHFRDETDNEIFAVNTEYLDGATLSPATGSSMSSLTRPGSPPGDYRVEAFLP